MRIGIDTFSFDKPGENQGVGPGVYLWKLLPELIDQGAEDDFIVFANHDNQSLVPKSANVKLVISPLSNRIRSLRLLHEQVWLPWQAIRHRLDVIHFFGNNICLALRKKAVITIHDLMWKFYLQELHILKPKFLYFALTVPISAKLSRAVIAVSQFTSMEIVSKLGVPTNRVFAIPEASGGLAMVDTSTNSRLKEKYKFSFIFSVTTTMPHKNLKVLLSAFALLKKTRTYAGKLVVAGQLKGIYSESAQRTIFSLGLENDVVLTGFISEEEKSFLYRESEVFVYPSLYEGFGLPVLEAMEAGVPVVASQTASIPEVGGDACSYFDPNSADDIVEKLSTVLNNVNKRIEMVQRGGERARRFSWSHVARETRTVYEFVKKQSLGST